MTVTFTTKNIIESPSTGENIAAAEKTHMSPEDDDTEVVVLSDEKPDMEDGCQKLTWTFFRYGYRSIKSRNAIYSVVACNAVFGILMVNGAFSILSVNSFFSIASVNSLYSLGSANSAFSIGCVGSFMKICL
jgi:hypothetical protein